MCSVHNHTHRIAEATARGGGVGGNPPMASSAAPAGPPHRPGVASPSFSALVNTCNLLGKALQREEEKATEEIIANMKQQHRPRRPQNLAASSPRAPSPRKGFQRLISTGWADQRMLPRPRSGLRSAAPARPRSPPATPACTARSGRSHSPPAALPHRTAGSKSAPPPERGQTLPGHPRNDPRRGRAGARDCQKEKRGEGNGRSEETPPRRSPAGPALPARAAARSDAQQQRAPRGQRGPSALPADLKPRTARRSRCASPPAGPAERSQAGPAARAAGEARGAGAPHLSLSREVLSAAAAGGTRLLPLSTKKASPDSPGPAKLRAVAEPGSHLQRPSDSGSRHGSARHRTARFGPPPSSPLEPPPPRLRPPARPERPRGRQWAARCGTLLLRSWWPGQKDLPEKSLHPHHHWHISWQHWHPLAPGTSCRPSTMAPILTAVPWQHVPEKYPGVTAHLLTAKSKSTCLNALFPVKETLHHRSCFVPAWSF
ncbi:uncharacterized protein LOC143695712 [Agelaius phoeniceus]|uniref:uncharacterized protein LOC143695712 n=1 Tax=Agelaius phoeniceus TaxID=39638 RepID=UPI0040552892